MEFLGSCQVCGKVIHNYRGLAGHLRHNQDPSHQHLKASWLAWRAEYRATLRCRKCGDLWEVRSTSDQHNKRCPRCEEQLRLLGKRAYAAWRPPVIPDVRVRVGSTKARWRGLNNLHFKWQRGDRVYVAVRAQLSTENSVRGILQEHGITYKTFKAIAQDVLGVVGYSEWCRGRKARAGSRNLRISHANYRKLSPEEKSEHLRKKYGGTCKLEKDFAAAVTSIGVADFVLNAWQAVPVEGALVPREADLKINLAGHKVVVLCDGEAFHGPKFVFGDVNRRVADDVATAEAYFSVGYSVIRYSETELRSGLALDHLVGVLPVLRTGRRLLRLWHPPLERWQ